MEQSSVSLLTRREPCCVFIAPNVVCTVRDATTRRVLRVVRGHNKVVNVGLDYLRDLFGGTVLRPSDLAVGDSNTAVAAGDTALGNEILRKTIDRRIPTTGQLELQVVVETGEGNGTTFREIGTFAASVLVARSVLASEIPKTALVEVTVSHLFTFTSGT